MSSFADDDFDEYEFDDECSWCDGEGEDECNDPIQCTRRHTTMEHPETGQVFQFCVCAACGGSGRAKDQTIW